MTEEETFASPKMMLVFAIVATCLWFTIALYALSGVYNHEPPYVTTWYLVIHLVFLASLWFEVAEKKKMLNKRWVRYIQAVLMVIIILLIASYYLLL